MRALCAALCALLLTACEKSPGPESVLDRAPRNTPAPVRKAAPRPRPGAEPERVIVDRILISFKGAHAALHASRSKQEARKLAYELYERIRSGARFVELRNAYSDDRVEGAPQPREPFRISNFGVQTAPIGEFARERSNEPAFTDLAFALRPGDVGMVDYHPKDANLGWSIVRRLR
ncbi:MAG: peptidylprolyl isomerase [Planctomycetota bacterium]|nr:peptidylprolyl isomerase [Planctomycetota bacterium]